MEKQRAINLLNDTFNSDFSINRFAVFVKELFNNFNVDVKTWSVWKEYLDYIESYQLLGSYKDNSKKVIDVLVVKLRKTGSRDRARTMQRNFVAKHLSNAEKDAALIAFYGDDPQDWRYSFVKMEYNLVKDDSGKVIVAKELTPAKRYSFLVGVNEPNYTCRSQFLSLVMEEEINPSLADIEAAFSIDNVTKEFFNEYKELFLELEESLRKVIKKDNSVKEEFESKGISTVDFSKKLLGQIVFIYFLQKKGWLGVKKGEKWGDGPKDFMRCLFGGGIRSYKPLVPYKNFFNEILEPLFYEALANDRSADDHFYRLFNCKIPFLNGGLFEPINDYKWAETDIVIDNAIFDRILSTFDRFNFTVKEDEPLEKEVAVDPEMLGKVFENLLEVKDRKSKGAFYTPREIVHYMCQQSLINYLETNINIPRKDIEKFIQLGDLTLANSIRVLQEVDKKQEKLKKGIISAKIFEEEIKRELEKLDLPKSIIENYKEIDRLLKEIKIVDPAVGSGAFPVGMMNEIIKARSILSMYFHEKRSDYDLKREIIENCLYGVDIESSAVDITKLRFWLSLIVDELDMQNIKPLPNLDHKIMCGNSLLEEFEGVKLFDEKLLGEVKKDVSFEVKQIEKEIADLYKQKGEIARGKSNGASIKEIEKEIKKLENKRQKLLSAPKENDRDSTLDEALLHRRKESQKKLAELKSLQTQFFNAENRNIKKQLRDKIDKIEWELIEETLKEQGNLEAMQKLEQYKKNKAKPFFLWKLYFAEVFQRENPGFDVVIANPPYFNIRKDLKLQNACKHIYPEIYNGQNDVLYYFVLRALTLLREDGNLMFIISRYFLEADSAKKFREYLLNKSKILHLIDFGNNQLFEEADILNCILFLQAVTNQSNNKFQVIKFENRRSSKQIVEEIDNRFIEGSANISIKNQDDLTEDIWIFFDEGTAKILDKIKKDSVTLGEIAKTGAGIQSGLNDVFVVDEKTIKEYVLEKDLLRNYAKTRDIKSYYIIKRPLKVIRLTNEERINDYPNVRKYLEESKNRLEKRYEAKKGLCKWFSFSVARNMDIFDSNKEKIISPIYSTSNKFGYDSGKKEENFMTLSDTVVLQIKNKEYNTQVILAILNSALLNYYYKKTRKLKRDGYYEYLSKSLNGLPIKYSEDFVTKIIPLVNEILEYVTSNDFLKNPDKQAKVKKLEKEIDQLVYKLYELTPDEIKIVEDFCNKT